jgi:hypothetical protein
VKYNAYDFSTGFDHGFDKFATNVQGEQQKVSSAPKKNSEPKKRENDGFDFNFDQ